MVVLAGCGPQPFPINSSSFTQSSPPQRGMSDYEQLPSEPSKQSVLNQIQANSYPNAVTMVEKNFPLLDVVTGGATSNNQRSQIYVTQLFTLEELSKLITDKYKPDKQSEVLDNKQIFIYPNHFVTLRTSTDTPGAVFMEVATDEFVRNNYSPNYFNGFFTLLVLDRVLGVNDWGRQRNKACLTSDCYKGYTPTKKYRSGTTGTLRGSSVRGGGPSAGK